MLGGFLTYSQGLMIGMLISLFAAFITSFYTYIQNAFMDPDYVNRFAEAQKNWIVNFMSGKVPDEKIEQTIADINAKMSEYSPLKSMFQGIVGSTLVGTIISLITSAILKRKPNPFQQNLDSNI